MDLNDLLFRQMERLDDKDLKGNELQREITRAKSIGFVASQIISNGKLALEAHKVINDGLKKTAPEMLGVGGDEEAAE